MKIRVFRNQNTLALAVAERICTLAQKKADRGETFVLGLAAGSSPRGIYRALELKKRLAELDLSRSIAFCLDEYYPIDPADSRSYQYQLSEVSERLGLSPARLRVPPGNIPREEVARFCEQYEEEIRAVGGIDLQIVGIGRTGHIGFNEPGSAAASRTRLVSLHETTRRDAAADFGGLERTPRQGITMGVSTILGAKEIAFVATGEHKAGILRQVLEEPSTSAAPASFLQSHGCTTAYLDEEAARFLAHPRCA